MAGEIGHLLGTITNYIPKKFLEKFEERCDSNAPAEFLNRFPAPYGDEIKSIADATGDLLKGRGCLVLMIPAC